MSKHYRHGDLLIVEIDAIPQNARLRSKQDGVLAEGEATGHFHRLCGVATAQMPAELFDADRGGSNELYFRTTAEAALTHDEHATIVFPKEKAYRVVRQREYVSPGESRQVLD